MIYPAWDACISNSLLIAIIAIVHVFVSHFAIGGGLYLVIAETIARKRRDDAHLDYVKRHSRFFMLVTVVFGAVTGVGIWVTIGLIHPVGTKWLINNFVWGWATEWVFFFVEIASIIIYYYGWKKLSPKLHLAIGWIYFVAAWLSLFIINGIVAFMLTPGQWLVSGSFWDGFFNPTFWPSLIFRTCLALILAGLYASLTIAREKRLDLKIRLQRYHGILILGALILAAPSAWWYFKALPAPVSLVLTTGIVPQIAVQVMIVAAAILFLLTLLGNIVFPRHSGYISAAILLACGMGVLGGFEWSREAIRKPFVIHDFLYSNNVLFDDTQGSDERPPMTILFSTGDRGRDLFLHSCKSCHSLSGYKSLDDKLAGMSVASIADIIPRLQFYLEPMPPFAGDDSDAMALARFLADHARPDPLHDATLSEDAKSEIVFARYCGGCHTMAGNRRPLGDTFDGLSYEDAEEIILSLQDLTDQMPPFTGNDAERKLLIRHLIGPGGGNE